MKTLESLYLKNVVVVKEAELPLNIVGITQIRGHNKDSKVTGKQTDVNAVGKSLLMRTISEIIFSSSPTTQTIKSRTKGDMFTHKDTEFGISVSDGRKLYSFSKHANKKSYDYKISVNGKNSKVRTKAYAENKIRSLFDYSEDEFYSIVFVDSRRTTKLQIGSTTERIDYFTNLFRLNDYDSVRKIFNAKLNEAKKSAVLLKEIKSQIKDLSHDTEGYNSDKLYKELKLVKKVNKTLVSDYSKLNNEKVKLLTAKSNKDNFFDYKSLVKELKLPSELNKQRKYLEQIIKEQEENKKLVTKWDYYTNSLKTYDKKYSKLNSEFKELGIDKDIKKLREKNKTISCEYGNALDTINRTKGAVEPEFDIDIYNKFKKRKLRSIKELKSLISKYESKLEIYCETLKALKNIHGEDCPTCQQAINKKTCDNLKKTYQGKKDFAELSLKDLRIELKDANKLEQLEMDYDGYKFAKSEYKKMMVAEKDAKEVVKKLKPKLEKIQNGIDILAKLDNLEKPRKPDKKLKGKFNKKQYKKLVSCLTLLNTIYPVYSQLLEINFDKLEKTLEGYSAKLESVSKELELNSVLLSKVTSKIDLLDSNLKRLSVLKEKEDKLVLEVNDIEVIEGLIEAYSNKGVKLIIIKHIAQMIEENINKYVDLMYTEPTKFKFIVKDDKNFEIKICRKVNGQQSEADIRTLSGVESRAFSFLLPLSILPLIPNDRRLNLMVLDEPMVNMGEARKELFVSSFIPKLNSIVPHLIIVSTDNENYPNANVYTMVKSKGVSTLVKS